GQHLEFANLAVFGIRKYSLASSNKTNSPPALAKTGAQWPKKSPNQEAGSIQLCLASPTSLGTGVRVGLPTRGRGNLRPDTWRLTVKARTSRPATATSITA